MFFFDETEINDIECVFVENCYIFDFPRKGAAAGVPRPPGRVLRHRGTLCACVWASGVADAASGGRNRDNSVMRCHEKSGKTMVFHRFS